MTTVTAEQTGYLATLEDVANMLQRAHTNMKKCPKLRLTEGYLKARIKTVEDYWEAFKNAHSSLTKCTPREQREDIAYFVNEEYYKVEELYLCIHGDMSDILIKSQQRNTDSPHFSGTSKDGQLSFAKLPRIQLPIFSGKYEDWPSFEDLFLALVHNTDISDVQKLHYLKTSVSGEAEILLRNIQITESNYTNAWEVLKTRFGNKRMIANSILKRLFGQKKLSSQSAGQIKSILDTTVECLSSLNNLKINTDSWDPVIIFLISQKLDAESLKDWEEQAYKASCDDMPTWDDMKGFLQSKFRTLELIAPTCSTSVREKQTTHKAFHVATDDSEGDIFQAAHTTTTTPQILCTFCKADDHYIQGCKDFRKLPVEERHSFVKINNLCFNCMIPNHSVFVCKNKTRCRVCRRKHNFLLHQNTEGKEEEKKEKVEERQQKEEIEDEHNITNAHLSKEEASNKVLLATAQVKVKGRNGERYTLRALIDQGSEASFISARAVELLGLFRTNINGVVSGVGEGTQIPIKHLVDLSVTSRFSNENELHIQAYVLKSITSILPSKHITRNWAEVEAIQLADPTYCTPGKIDLLLGADVFSKIIEDGVLKMSDGIVAQKTSLGWIMSGQQETKNEAHHTIIAMHITGVVHEDNDMLRKFWEIETESYQKRKILTDEEKKCETIYKKTTKREQDGRYTVHLPLKQSLEATVNLCGDTKQQAISRFNQLEKKFQGNELLKREYTKVIQEYLEMGHMRKSDAPDHKLAIYLPHHAIIRDDKDTTKVRVVYDASAKGKNGKSLNDTMMIGPVLQPDLRSLINSWRKHKICVVGDIVKMYRMINMTEEHTNLQRIVWRNNVDENLESYNLTTVSFGTAAAPFLSVRTLNQLADDEEHEFPDSAPVIKKAFYMDDLMTGNENVELTTKMCEDIKTILLRGGFEMQKWSSNSDEVLRYLEMKDHSTKDKLEIKFDKVIKILGLTWDRKDDAFKITVNLPEIRGPVTKRSILSDIARLFDPFGWLAPIIVTAKALIQKLWLCSLGWDDELSTALQEEWISYREELIHLQNISVPRWLKTSCQNKDVQLHGFADASTQAYAAVAYLRIVEEVSMNDNTKTEVIHVTMIASRTKVAPLKQLSVPKLELCAAALLAQLINDLEEILNIPKDKIFAWTDSMVVLSWLQSHPNRWQTFVANRVADITRVLNNSCWRHVQTSENPADIASRGSTASDMASLELWWKGPKWLQSENLQITSLDIPETDLELKGSTFHAQVEEKPIWERFSSMLKMKRVLAYCRRMLKSVKPRPKYLTPEELEIILEECIKYYQNIIYGTEIEDLKRDGKVKKRSSLITLSPYLDEKSLLRVGGRLQNASVAEITKHPIIIPSNQHITKLLIREAHLKTLHGGIQLMMAYVRSKYWVINLKSAIKKCIRSCKTCVLDKAKTKNQMMGQLPAMRVNPHRAFLNSGVDYAGPVFMRTSKGRGHHATKGYICLFVCMSTRAIHLEAVTDLSSQAFMAAFRRFVARRGHCLNLWSDNGTNFIGAAKELKEIFSKATKVLTEEVAALLANDGTTAHFIPPRMPSYGGLWEAGVQSAKRHLSRVNKDTKLTYEEMATLLAQIEACLNSRPLCLIDQTSETPLTPGHFLIGEPMISVPDLSYTDKKISALTRWQLIQKMTQDFWHRWQIEYLNTMQQRYKWQVAIPSPSIGDVVIIKDENMPPTKWLLGRIKHLHPGADNLVRVVTVECKGKRLLKRPLSKIVPLPTEDKDE